MTSRSVSARLQEAIKDAGTGTAQGLFDAAHHLLGEAQELVPHRDGDLERSGKATSNGTEAAVSFDTPYAVPQHENVDYAHPNGRQSKYLETPMNTEKDALLALIRDAVRKEMGFK